MNIKDDNSDQLSATNKVINPKSLDDIVRKVRDELQIRLANELEIQGMQADIDMSTSEDIYDNWSLISFITPHHTYFRLIGEARSCKKIKISSSIFLVDSKNSAASTWIGPVYQLGTPNEGEPDINHLMCLCFYLHDIGIGSTFGVPEFFY
ncbi:MAG: hypothetical protein BVN34_08605 [Proteobacteria bacterium ST_bin12]|nr:MAG: hypothetical protein BVN34_08605 [Proteobacteria bacterium ST_bin12]